MLEAEIRTFLIADIRGYTRFTLTHGDEAAALLAVRFAQIMREAVEAHAGDVIELRGDEALAVFTSARQALRAAVDAQLVFVDEVELDAELPFRVGMGLDAGEAVPVEDGYRGGALNLAARLCSKAAPGEILASQAIVHLARVTDGITFQDRGEYELKGMSEPTRATLVAPEGLGPESLGQRIEAAISAGSSRPSPSEVPVALDPVTPIVGRDREARTLSWSWRRTRRGEGRTVAIVGPPGIGKTRLAAEAAALPALDGARVAYVPCAEADDAAAASAIDAASTDERPTLLVIDDAGLAGPSTIAALSRLGQHLRSLRMLCILTYDDQRASPEIRAAFGRAFDDVTTIRPAPLNLDEVRQIAALYFGAGADALPAAALEATDGIPRKVHEFVSEWAHQEASRRLGDAASRAASGRSDLRTVEASLAGSVVDLQLIQERARLFAGEAPSRDGDDEEPPFKGLAPFGVGDAAWFFGRERLVADMIARLAGATLLGVVGPSGSGKSSAVRAGLVPSLRAGALPGSDRWTVAVMRPGEHPLRELDRAVWAALPERVRTKVQGSDLPLRAARDALDEPERIVIVVDQFEEVFTTCSDEAERTAFVSSLTDAADDPRGRVAVILAVRADYYGRCASIPALAAQLGANHVLVGPMTADEYRRAIEQPAIRAGLRVEPALADALVSEVLDEPGGLPLLSTALLELWEHRDGRTLRARSYVETGGVRGAVARLAEDAYAELTEAQRGVARSVMLRLAGPGEGQAVVRRRAPLVEFDAANNPDVATVLSVLTERRLLTVSEGSVEVAHEALLREWPRLQAWIEEDRAGLRLRAHVTEAAREWEDAGEDPGELYRGVRLASALDWTAEHTLDLNDLERRFLNESREANERAAEHQRRSNRRLRGLLAGVAVLLVLALVAGSVALAQRAHARTAATVSLAQRLGAQGVSQSQLSRALLLAREGLALAPSDRTEGSLLSTLLRGPGVMRAYAVTETERPLTLGLSNGGRTLGMSTNVGRVHFFDVATGKALGSSPSPTDTFFDCCVAGSAGEAVVVISESDGSLRLAAIDPATGRTLRTFAPSFPRGNQGYVDYVASPDGATAYVATSFPDASGKVPSDAPTWIYRWDTATGASLGRTSLGPGSVLGIDLINGGTGISVLTTAGPVLVDSASMRVVRRASVGLQGYPATTNADGTIAALVSLDSSYVEFVDLGTAKIVRGVGNPLTQIDGVAFSPTDPALAVTTGDDGTAVLWDARTGHAAQVLPLHASRVTAVRFAPDGSSFYTVSLDGTVIRSSLSGRGGFGSSFNVAAPGAGPIGQPSPAVAAAPDRSAFAQGATAVAIIDDATGRQASFDAAPAGFTVNSLALSPDGRTLAVGSYGGADQESGDVRLFDVSGTPTLERVLPLDVKYPGVNAVGFGPDGARVFAVTGNTDPKTGATLGGCVVAWNARTAALAFPPIVIEGYRIHQLAIDREATLAALGLYNDQGTPLRLIRLPSGAQVGSAKIPTQIDALAFASDGSLLVGDYAGRVQRLEVPALRPIGQPVLTGGGPLVSIVAVTNAPRYVSTNFDGSTRLWDLTSGQEIGSSFTPLASKWTGASVSSDGRTLAILASDGGAWIFPLSGSTWAHQACRAAGRNLTRAEWSEFVGALPYAKVCPQYPLG